MTKVTKRDMFLAIADALADTEGTEELVEFVGKEIALIDKRKEAGRKATPAQVENESIKRGIADALVDGAMTATDVANGVGITVQKASQLLRQLVLEGTVTRTDAKGKEKASFALSE
jgi:predicted Rossmann fold nucleotide-binding protein DprA/Smf involved in DNA uptake